MAKNKHTESLQGSRIRISGLTREPVFPKTSKKLVDRNKTAMLHPLKDLYFEMHRILECLYCANASEGIASLKMFMLRGELGHEARTGRYLMTVPKKKKKTLAK